MTRRARMTCDQAGLTAAAPPNENRAPASDGSAPKENRHPPAEVALAALAPPLGAGTAPVVASSLPLVQCLLLVVQRGFTKGSVRPSGMGFRFFRLCSPCRLPPLTPPPMPPSSPPGPPSPAANRWACMCLSSALGWKFVGGSGTAASTNFWSKEKSEHGQYTS